jgi:DNA-binding NtrC family response regulator
MSEDNIILYISDGASRSDSVLAGLKEKGYEVVSTDSPTEGVALLYVMHSAAAVLVDKGASEQADFDLVQSLRQTRPKVPVTLLCGEQIDSSPSQTGTCVKKDDLASGFQHLLTAESVA